MKDIKEQIQTSAEYLCGLCLEDRDVYRNYSDRDLFNAVEIFAFFLLDKVFSENKSLSQEKIQELAITTGKAIRELVKSSTGKDMHKIAKTL